MRASTRAVPAYDVRVTVPDPPAARPPRFLVALLVVSELVLVGVAAWLWAASTNTLERHGAWVATKARLERPVVGGRGYATSRRTLAFERLDLGRWFGHQEVLTAQPQALASVDFDFRLAPQATLCFLISGAEDAFVGLRVGTDERFPDAFLTVSEEGEFRSLERVPSQALRPGRWLHARVELGGDELAFAVDGAPPVRRGVAPPERVVFGFRNGQEPVAIDDVRAVGRDGTVWHDSFANRGALARALALGLGLLLAVDAVLVRWLLPRLWRHGSPLRGPLVGLAVLVLLVPIGAFVTYRGLARGYTRATDADELDWRRGEARDVCAALRARYAAAPAPGTTRVMVLGSSQTGGAGARRPEEVYATVLEKLLNAGEGDGNRFEVVNAGICGLTARSLADLYRDELLAFEPRVCVVDLAYNDSTGGTDAAVFGASIGELLALNRARGIATLLALEPCSPEAVPGELPLHAVLRALAEREGVPLVDLHALLKARGDAGFLWWDPVHPTSFGHRLIAEALAPAVAALGR